jgi:hypothetical protein
MNSTPRGRSGRRTMELLAQARPASLDPGTDPGAAAGRRQDTIAAALRTNPEAPPRGAASMRSRPRVPRAALATGLTLAAAGAAAAVFVAGSGPGAAPAPISRTPKTGSTPSVTLTAQQILFTAAVSAAQQPAQGRYWKVTDISGSVMAAGPNAHPYAVEQTWSPSVTWDARSPRQRSWTMPASGFTTTPVSAGAAAAWRAGGSPKLPSRHGRQQGWWQTGGTDGYLGNGNLTSAQFQRLPASPARLSAVVKKAAEQQIEPSPNVKAVYWSTAGKESLAETMFGVYDQLLKLDPITPAVRAAVFRDLARLPGVHSIGKVTDPLGRTGYGIAQSQGPADNGAEQTEEVLVIAPGSGLLLADEFVVTSTSYSAPSSGAAPGLGTCPKGTALPKINHPMCKLSAAQAKQLPASEGLYSGHGFLLVGPGPMVELASGQVESFDAIVGARWTNASPALPSPSQRFSVVKDSKG